jgi:hypothetical protein
MGRESSMNSEVNDVIRRIVRATATWEEAKRRITSAFGLLYGAKAIAVEERGPEWVREPSDSQEVPSTGEATRA